MENPGRETGGEDDGLCGVFSLFFIPCFVDKIFDTRDFLRLRHDLALAYRSRHSHVFIESRLADETRFLKKIGRIGDKQGGRSLHLGVVMDDYFDVVALLSECDGVAIIKRKID